jgi:ABC transport system ATP-binding/permease protein
LITQPSQPPPTIQPISASPSNEPPLVFRGIQLEVRDLSAQTGKDLPAFSELSFQVQPGELVAVMSPDSPVSAEVLRVLAGLVVSGNGQILYDGVSLPPNRKIFRSYIGYVPAENILYEQLTLKENLLSTAALHLPRDTRRMARHQRVEEVITTLGLQYLQTSRLSTMTKESRRVSNFAAEIIPLPGLLFIEQPQESLDPPADLRNTALLRSLAQQGATVLFETQASRCAMLADKVLLLAPDGTLAWFGPAAEALIYFQEYFQVDKSLPVAFEDILLLLQAASGEASGSWAKRFKASPAYTRYVDAPLNDEQPDLILQDRPVSHLRKTASEKILPPPIVQTSSFSKTATYIRRGTRLLARSRAGLLMLLTPIFVALLDFLLSSADMFDPLTGDANRIPVSLGLLVFLNLFFSALVFQREILKEKDIHRHEYRFLKSTSSYVFSKLWFVFFFAIYQGTIWTIIHAAATGFHSSVVQLISSWITFSLAGAIGSLLGLAASTLANTPYAAIAVILLLTLPQLILSGSVIPLPHFPPAIQALSLGNPARYAFEALLTISRFGRDVMADSCWRLPEDQRILLNEAQKQNCQCTGENLFSRCNFPGIHKFFTVIIEQPRPEAPTPDSNLAEFPTQPELSQGESVEEFSQDASHFAARLESYQGSIDAYTASLRKYAENLANWQRTRSIQIGNAEGLIAEAIDYYGQGLQVNLSNHWLMLIDLCFGFVLLFGGIQKGKDVSQW